MHFTSSLLALVALTTQALAFPLNNLPKRDTGLAVKLSSIGNTRVKAVITNTADHEISFLKFNTFFDSSATRKVSIAKDGSVVPFNGLYRYYNAAKLPKEAFKTLAPGASAEATFDIAETSDLSAGGSFSVFSDGMIPVADGSGTTLTGAIKYSTNELKMNVDGALAAKVQSAIPKLEKRTRIDPDCPGEYRNVLTQGLQTAAGYASRAAEAATNGDQLEEFFKTTDQQTAQNIAQRFQAIAQECGSDSQGSTTYFCDDRFNGCEQGVIAYTIPAQSVVVNCPAYWELPPVVNQGLDPDHGYVVVHEFTHATSIFSPGTQDHAYGYENCIRLSPEQCISNADNYSLYAASVSRGG
ncbi:metalloproteinase 5 [Coccidioides immitis RS]|uniref:Neutral protease 2 n=4 Tax=Coccidioides immitis TaxID=5501 RepID=J3K8P0_COCIM|nr:metalloproteinase 5 [Coccidioides immitis RS]KMP03819.1 neutral protease 2 [Coccidioides immitis RMSCC 2394]KMU74797.1 neutral protease 2 [Coccidioides immitis RMSCC 3703]KMU83331.1 neutral protease 2 [Coccidioides immitis H538.4]TPX24048.1 ammonium permease mep3 [Coccidioides immitis]EAS31203.3 metalloproteinase 5 [Coccidioides immitis RS]